MIGNILKKIFVTLLFVTAIIAVPAPVDTVAMISTGHYPSYDSTLGQYVGIPYCLLSTPAEGSVNDNAIWITPLYCVQSTTTGLWTFTTQSKWLRPSRQVSLVINGTFEGDITGESLLKINPLDWDLYASFQNTVGDRLTNAISASNIADVYVFSEVLHSSVPDLVLDPTSDALTIVYYFLSKYYGTYDLVYQNHILVQLIIWSSLTGRQDVTLNPIISALFSLSTTFIVNVRHQAAAGLIDRFD